VSFFAVKHYDTTNATACFEHTGGVSKSSTHASVSPVRPFQSVRLLNSRGVTVPDPSLDLNKPARYVTRECIWLQLLNDTLQQPCLFL
jgi:hypothetical protein